MDMEKKGKGERWREGETQTTCHRTAHANCDLGELVSLGSRKARSLHVINLKMNNCVVFVWDGLGWGAFVRTLLVRFNPGAGSWERICLMNSFDT